jgi:hypothetical protein
VADVDRRTGGTHEELEWPVPWSALPKRQRRRRFVVVALVAALWLAAFAGYLVVSGEPGGESRPLPVPAAPAVSTAPAGTTAPATTGP